MKRLNAYKAGEYNEDDTVVVELDKATAILVITDLLQDISDTGVGKLVLRTSDNKFLILRVA